ncbi:N-acetylmuramoyl-L-alanine amidase [Radiobacillus deserti]|uniref:SH3 domain-containing protein n=1 Tax=Radiobacillus deserti TaxID=2594883 RepID=A0A516KJL3_9BACI|nr:N-acetylmuramoyl-L-alanine amidase [Radiobacillus deserti]QDP41593.1 SH3 domain-containing protein [Radiobacillus deserti]
MKKWRILVSLCFSLLVLFIVAPKVAHADTAKVATTKSWTVEFNTEMSSASINNSTIYVLDANGAKQATTVSLSSDKKKAIVKPPSSGYKPGQTYTLVVTDNLYSIKNNPIKQAYSKTFTIEEVPTTPPVGYGTVTADVLNVRSGPGTSYSRIGQLTDGKIVAVYEISGDWATIDYNGTVGYVHKTYIKIQNPAGTNSIEGRRIVIDAGHGGKDPGASAKGTEEADIVLDVALRVQRKLSVLGAVPILTRSTDEFLELYERVQLAEDKHGDIFISIHVNAATAAATGAEAFYYKGKAANEQESYQLARSILDEIVDRANMVDRGVKHGDLHVIRENPLPATLIELGFITNSSDYKKLTSATYRDIYAEAIVEGIKKYYQQ